MDHTKQATIPTAATEHATVLLGLELSRKSWVIALQKSGEAQPSLHTRDAGDLAAVTELIEKAGRALSSKQGKTIRAVCCYEAGRDAFWVQRALEKREIRTYVIDPASIRVPRRARRAKTDTIDARELVRVLRAYLRGERDACCMVRVPTPAEEDAKRPNRQRGVLIAERVRLVNRIKSWCATEGITQYQPARADRRARLAELRTAEGEPLPPSLRHAIELEVDRLELVLTQIAKLEKARNAVLKAPAAERGTVERKIQDLASLRGVGPQCATLLAREVFYRSFRNRRQLGRYLGLDGSPYSSGSVKREQGISKVGNARARTTMIELAWLWLTHQPKSALSLWFNERVGKGRGLVVRITIVALARKLAIALWRFIETGLPPEGAQKKKAA